jgi:hypothetical protein
MLAVSAMLIQHLDEPFPLLNHDVDVPVEVFYLLPGRLQLPLLFFLLPDK